MSVKIRKRKDAWWIFVNHDGQRKAKQVGTRAAAEAVKRELEARLALGDVGCLQSKKQSVVQTFGDYADQWLIRYAKIECKPSSVRSYEQLLRVHIKPQFGTKRLTGITRDDVKNFLAEKSSATRSVNGALVPEYAKNTLRLIMTALRTVLFAAVEDKIIEKNPASKVGKFVKTERPAHKARAMTKRETEQFLTAIEDVCPDWHTFFLTALRAGLRKGELIALQWGDIQFGESESDSNRYILVQRNFSCGCFTTPKSGNERRVDLSRQLRAALIELRDAQMLKAFQEGRNSIAEDLIFPSQAGTVIKPDNIFPRYMQPALEKAGLRRFRFHDLRHTFGSLLIQDGASLAYVKEQMGHSSIQVTVDTYGHLIPGGGIAWIDRLDVKTTQQQSATPAQPAQSDAEDESSEVIEKIGCPPGIRTPIC